MSQLGYIQDMPPAGGYGNINYERQIPKKPMGFFTKFGLYAGVTTAMWYLWYKQYSVWRMRRLEMMDSRYAVKPIILAEQHRHMMRHWRKNRDYENELMKDVPGWTTGMLYDEPLYYNIRGRYMKPSHIEYFAHNSFLTEYNHLQEKLDH